MNTFLSELSFLRQRITSGSVADILLVAFVFFVILKILDETRAAIVMRGIVIAGLILGSLSLFTDLPAFNWLVSKALPAFVIMIPIVFASEIRRVFEKVGEIRNLRELFYFAPAGAEKSINVIDPIVDACCRLSANHHGALIVMEYFDNLDRFVSAGVIVDAKLSAKMLLQIFYPNTPLHDGAVIVRRGRIHAASCVMPLSNHNALNEAADRHMGLRHRASLGISEESDCVAIVVSEETGAISYARKGELHRNVSPEKLTHLLTEMYTPVDNSSFFKKAGEIVRGWGSKRKRE